MMRAEPIAQTLRAGRIASSSEESFAMAITVGSRLPEAKFTTMTPSGAAPKTTSEIFGGKKIVLFAVPGAFTPTCHRNHLPGFP